MNYKVRPGTGKRLRYIKNGLGQRASATEAQSCVYKVNCDQEYNKGTDRAMIDDR